ncbi:hypothetical protein IMCC3317_42180 [Kordia antarctica]|uniref:Uncharacterized protein n=1 Tax=Kordia antarctica TaxID=1218801 RepID=A0A7L4ZQ05_9FLAO|nr:hypothetical protein [Kordia antarctica]QHI38818.1 hypothetical protein IMCC3317_42180 [Kordia antarctica]
MEKQKFVKTPEKEHFLPVNYFLMEGEEIINNITVGGIDTYTECEKLNSEGYKCVPFYKKISRYL